MQHYVAFFKIKALEYNIILLHCFGIKNCFKTLCCFAWKKCIGLIHCFEIKECSATLFETEHRFVSQVTFVSQVIRSRTFNTNKVLKKHIIVKNIR